MIPLTYRIIYAQNELRDEYRIKLNVDYAVCVKYELVNVMCIAVYQHTIVDIFTKHNIVINTIHQFD